MLKPVCNRVGAGAVFVAALLLGGGQLQRQIAAETADLSGSARAGAMYSRWQATPPVERASRRACAPGGVRIDPGAERGTSSAGKPPPRLQGGRPASEPAEAAQIPAASTRSAARSTPVRSPERSPPTARRPPIVEADEELAAAQREFDAAFSHYTTLVTTGGEGNVEQARDRYRETYERLKALKRDRGIE